MHTQDKAVHRLIATQAAEWHIACSEGDLAPQQARAFMAWLRASPLHVAEFLRVTAIASEIAEVSRADPTPMNALELTARDPTRFAPPAHLPVAFGVCSGAGRETHAPHSLGAGGVTRRIERRMVRSAAAALALAVLVGAVWFGWGHSLPAGSVKMFATAHGQQRSLVLPDHTMVDLDSDSAISVHFNSRERHVVVDRGQVYFSVARDPARPFSVRVEHSLVRDIGTSFDVYRHPSGSAITVAEGHVQVWMVSDQHPPSTQWSRWFEHRTKRGGTLVASLGAGRQVQLTTTGQVVSLGDTDVRQDLAWRRGQIAFDNQSIASVVAQFNRYNRTQIRVADPHLAALPITGVFDARDVAAFTAFLSSLPGVRVSHAGETVTVLAAGHPDHHHR